MHFGHPEILLGIFALPLLALFFWWSQRRKRRLLERFGQWSAVARLIEATSTGKQALKMALLTLCVTLLIAALARPQWGASERRLARRGIDLMIAVDVSNSMLATDIQPNRLSRAKDQLRQLIMNSRGHRIGILTFAGEAFVQCPLTLDYGLALNILDAVDVGIIQLQGTSLGNAIEKTVDAFEQAEPGEGEQKPQAAPLGDRVLLLLTDGEDHDTAALQKAAARARKAGIKVYAIAIGSPDGARIIMPDGTMKKNAENQPVTSRVNYEALEQIAFQTGGVAIRGTAGGDLDLLEAQKHLNELEKSVQRSTTQTVYEERFVPILVLLLALLVWEMFQGDRQKMAGAEAAVEAAGSSRRG